MPYVMCFLTVNVEFRVTRNQDDVSPGHLAEQALCVIKRALTEELGWQVHDCGTHSAEAVDYPDFAAAVGREVAAGRAVRGIVIDAAGRYGKDRAA